MGLFDGKIPSALYETNNWVCSVNGNKLPFNPLTGTPASVSDSSTWGTFDEATQEVLIENCDGVGYVFCNNGIVGIDIDIGYDEDGFISDMAMDIIEHCKSYTETSRSGRGFHIFVKGELPFKGKNNQSGVEIYREARWFITTGNVMFYDDVIENQDAIDYVVNKYFSDVKESNNSIGNRIYSAVLEQNEKRFSINYPIITEGGRNICLASIAGQLHTGGFDKDFILSELIYVNKVACFPNLPITEVESVVNSICKYTR